MNAKLPDKAKDHLPAGFAIRGQVSETLPEQVGHVGLHQGGDFARTPQLSSTKFYVLQSSLRCKALCATK